MEQVLQSPELLTRILEMVREEEWTPSRTSLAPLARVNSLWQDLVQRIIWEAPPVEALASIRKRHRQDFASYIRTLDFGGNKDPTLHTLFAGLQFSRLKKLELGNYPTDLRGREFVGIQDGWNSTVSQYLGPALEDLTVLRWDSICTGGFFKNVTEKCPRLRRIYLSGIGTQLQPDEFLSFLKSARHLEAIELNLGLGPGSGSALITGNVLLQLSKMPNLKYLELANRLKQPEIFHTVKVNNNAPFQTLTKFELHATSDVISAAVFVLPNVVKLTLCLQEGNGMFIKNLPAMPSLRKLKILGSMTCSFLRRELLTLRQLSQLEKLTLKMSDNSGPYEMLAPAFTDSDFDVMVSGLPELRKLVFDVIWETRSVSILSSLSEHCPKLESLALDGSYDIQALNDISTVMFPNLRYLRMDDCEVHNVPVRLSPLQLGRLIDNHAPILEDLVLMVDFDDNPVLSAWHDIRG